MMEWRSPRNRYVVALVISSLISLGLFAISVARDHSLSHSYLVWNLMLAWIPLLLVIRLKQVLQIKSWSSWEGLGLTLLWLSFLPNSFYMISDFIHLRESSSVDVLYDSLMFTSFIYTALALGFSSLYLVHLHLKRRLTATMAAGWIGTVLFITSVAIYLGRDLRWNTWDIAINPGGVLFDVSDRLQHVSAYPHMLVTIVTFFVLLVAMYHLLWRGIYHILHDRIH